MELVFSFQHGRSQDPFGRLGSIYKGLLGASISLGECRGGFLYKGSNPSLNHQPKERGFSDAGVVVVLVAAAAAAVVVVVVGASR